MRHSLRERATWAGIVVVTLALSSVAHAVEVEVGGEAAAQGYEVVSPFGDVILGRRRLAAIVGFGAYDLEGDPDPLAADYGVKVRVRLDADFGIDRAEASYDPLDRSRFVPGLAYAPVDLMVGYVEARNVARGLIGARLGRQYTSNVLGWWSFDGGLVRVTTPYFFAVEAYAGLEQRGGMPLSTSRFEAQGVWRGARRDGLAEDAHLYPSFQEAAVAPGFGVALESVGPNWIHGRFDYRRVYNLGAAFTSQFPTPGGGGFEEVTGPRISHERLGYALSAVLPDIGSARGGFVYDLYSAALSRAYAGLDARVGTSHTVGLDGEFFLPTFDADSIFNWFTHNPSVTALARAASRPTRSLQLSAQAGTRLWLTDGNPADWTASACAAAGFETPDQQRACVEYGVDPTTGPDAAFARLEANRLTVIAPDLIANFGAAVQWPHGSARLRASLETGFGGADSDRGRRVGGTLSAEHELKPGAFTLGGRVSTYEWHDPLRPTRDATSFGYVIAPEITPVETTKLRLEWEHDMNRLVGQRFRVVGWLTVRAP
ncbi:MAG: hypothetical protein EXR75_08285 [Myxococcales bacterium]|nr:hypothetical protein [Myxococcales bacterium]